MVPSLAMRIWTRAQRFAVPAATALAPWLLCFAIYNTFPSLSFSSLATRWVGDVAGAGMFVTVALGPLWVYPLARGRGASAAERVGAALLTPFAWSSKEVVRLTAAFTVAESAYYLLNPLPLGVLCAAVAEMGLCELVARRSARHVPSWLAIGGGLGGLGWLFGASMGEEAVYLFLDGYRRLFGPGVGV